MRILVLGATGMLGSTVFRFLSVKNEHQVFGSVRNAAARRLFAPHLGNHLISNVDAEDWGSLVRVFDEVRPEIVINCVGLIKQLASANDPLAALPINSLLPHRLSRLCSLLGARLIHISTDCVFSGDSGKYLETDTSDARDLYGKSKYLGEMEYPHTVTLRTSIIGHDLSGETHSLIGWFLSQEGTVNGYTKAIYSGLPTVELAHVIGDIVIPRPELSGLYQVASKPISKFDLLTLVAQTYGKSINIVPCDSPAIDRSLNAARFHAATGYEAPEWPELISRMYTFWKAGVDCV